MKIKVKRKSFLSSMIVTLFATMPLAGIISCAGNEAIGNSLTVGIRPEDNSYWEKVGKQFTKATGQKVKFKWISDQNNQYTLWSGSNNMPNITIADSNWARQGVTNGWFQTLDIKDIAENPAHMISGQDDIYKETKIKYDNQTFSTKMMETMKKGDKFVGQAVIYGPKLLYSWSKIPKGDGTYIDLLDGNVDLDYYVPNPSAIGLTKVQFPDNSENSPLYSSLNSDKHRLKNTQEDIQEFISNAINKENLKFNFADGTYKGYMTNGDPTGKNHVISTGPYGMIQRLVSAFHSIYQAKKTDLTAKGVTHALISDSGPFWAGLAYGDKPLKNNDSKFSDATMNLDDDNVLDENKVFNPSSKKLDPFKWNPRIKAKNLAGNNSELQARQYFGFDGYYVEGGLGTSKDVGLDDSQISFAKGKVLSMIDGAAWQWGSIAAKIENQFPGEDPSKLLTGFGEPIQITGVDGYALSKNLSAKKLLLAKKFLRFLMQPQAAADIAATKAISTIIDGANKQPKFSGVVANAFDGAGAKAFGEKNKSKLLNMPFELALGSIRRGPDGKEVSQIFGPYIDLFKKSSELDKKEGYDSTAEKYAKVLGTINSRYDIQKVATDRKWGPKD